MSNFAAVLMILFPLIRAGVAKIKGSNTYQMMPQYSPARSIGDFHLSNMKKKINISLLQFVGRHHLDHRIFATYLALRNLSYEGCIHNIGARIGGLGNQIGLQPSTLYNHLKKLKRYGWVWQEGQILWFKSHHKIEIDKQLRSKKYLVCPFKNVDEILVWLRTTIIYNNFNNQLYTRKKRISREVRKNIIVKDCKAYPKPLISRKGIARIVRYKSATSATNLIKKAANLNLLTDKVVIKKVREISFGEFMFLKNKSGLSARFFFKKGYLCEKKCNKIRFVEDKYLLAIGTIS